MNVTELQPADLPALLDLCRVALPFDTFTLSILERRLLHEPERTPAYQLLAWEGNRLLGAMMGGVRSFGIGRAAWLRLFAVRPESRRQGLASHLLEILESRLAADGIGMLHVGNSTPNYFWPGLDVRYTAAYCFLEHHGFQHQGEAVNMCIDLNAHPWDTSADEARLAGRGITIRRLRAEDRDAFHAWLASHWSPTWVFEGMDAFQNDPISAFVAVQDEQIRAFAAYNVTMFENGFGPMGTEESLRGLGVGRVLLYRCLADMKARGESCAEAGWVGPIAFYARVADGWVHRVFWWLHKQL
jgi:Acetyltransferases